VAVGFMAAWFFKARNGDRERKGRRRVVGEGR